MHLREIMAGPVEPIRIHGQISIILLISVLITCYLNCSKSFNRWHHEFRDLDMEWMTHKRGASKAYANKVQRRIHNIFNILHIKQYIKTMKDPLNALL